MNSLPTLSPARALVTPAVTVWGYIRHELLFLSFALLEVSLLTPVALVILGWARYWPPVLVTMWLLLLMLVPLNLIRIMTLLQLDRTRQRQVMVFSLLLAVVLSWRILLYHPDGFLDFGWLGQFLGTLAEGGNLLWTRDLSVFLLTIFVWWRGMRLAGRVPEINNTGLRLRLGALIFLPLIIGFSGNFLNFNITPFILLFFLAGLTTVTLVRAEQIEQEQQGTASTLNVRWFAIVLGAALIVILSAGILATFMGGESLFAVLGWFTPLWRALQSGAIIIGSVLIKLAGPFLDILAVIVQAISALLAGIMSLLSQGLRASGILEGVPTPEILLPTETVEVGGTSTGGKAIVAVIMLALIVLIGLALARAYSQANFAARESTRSRTEREVEEEEPSLGRRLLERLGLIRQWRAAASIRRIYRLMCQSAASSGFPRLETETPYEYLPTLAQVWPEHASEARLITEAFIRVRYGEFPETKEELESIRQAWGRLERAEPNQRSLEEQALPTLTKRDS